MNTPDDPVVITVPELVATNVTDPEAENKVTLFAEIVLVVIDPQVLIYQEPSF
jgi:hypothetical protein